VATQLTKKTITTTFVQSDGVTPAQGVVTARLTTALLDSAGSVIVAPVEHVAQIQSDGSISLSLVATNDPGVSPSGAAYTFTERIQGAKPRVYTVEIDHAGPDIINLADLVPATVTPVYTYALQSALTQGLADAATDATAKADAAQAAAITTAATDATTKAAAAQAAAESTAATALSSHNATTQNVHGIPDVAFLKRVSRVSVAAADSLGKHYQMADFKCDGNADAATINAAISEMETRGGAVELSYDTFAIEQILTLPSHVTLTGQGHATTILRMQAGANLECVIKSANYDALLASRVWYVQNGNNWDFAIKHLMVDGNKANQAAGEGVGAKIYGKWYAIEDVQLAECRGHGLVTQGGSEFGPITINDTEEAIFRDLWLMRNGGDGWWMDGPHDSICSMVQSGRNAGRGLYIGGRGSLDVAVMHVYGNSGVGIEVQGQFRAAYVGIDSNYGTGLWLRGPRSFAGVVYGWTPGIGKQPQHIVIDGDHNVIGDAVIETTAGDGGGADVVRINGDGNRFSGKLLDNLPTSSHIRIGATGSPAHNNRVDATVSATQGRVLTIEPGSAGNEIQITAKISGTATHWTGEESDSNTVRYLASDARSSANGAVAIDAAAVSATVTHGLLRKPALSEIQLTPLNNLGSATKFWASNPTSTTFSVNVDVAPGASQAKFAWRAELGAQDDLEPVGVSDTFTAPDATSLASHTADSGQGWTIHAGTFTIQSNTVVPADSGGPHLASLNGGLSDGTFRLKCNLGADPVGTTGDHQVSLVYRLKDANNYWYTRLFRANSNGAISFELYKVVDGVHTSVLGPYAVGALNTWHAIEVVLAGNAHTLAFDGTTLGTATDAAHQAATRVGVRGNNKTGQTPTGWGLDDLQVLA
jgi:hypothetical protein